MTGMLPICEYDFCLFILLNVLGKLINQRHVIVNVFVKKLVLFHKSRFLHIGLIESGKKLDWNYCAMAWGLVQVSGQFPYILSLYSQHMFAKLNWILPSRKNDMLPQVNLLANRLISKWDLLNTSCVQSYNVAIGEMSWGPEIRNNETNFTCSKDVSFVIVDFHCNLFLGQKHLQLHTFFNLATRQTCNTLQSNINKPHFLSLTTRLKAEVPLRLELVGIR